MSFPNHWHAKPPFYGRGPSFNQIGKHQRSPCILLSVAFILHKINLFIGERMTILHAWYNEGFVQNAEVVFRALSSSGNYHGEMNNKIIVRWLEDKLIPNLPPAAYHNVQVNRRPLMATKNHQTQ